jgi:CDP-paratose 2-epimerase
MHWLVTGGAGFVGSNVAIALIERGDTVVVVDDLSRKGSELNQAILRERTAVEVLIVDVTDHAALRAVFDVHGPFDAVAHMAGQVSLVASIEDPARDFEVNALGTVNVLECVRLLNPNAAVIGMSSNKAYGDLGSVRIVEHEDRYEAPDYPNGFDESLPLDFHGPYGCSKGTADQYLIDYHRTFGLRTFSLRQSSVYGPMQHPRSDQGWVGFLIGEAVAGRTIQLNGQGKQVRDLLHASDLAALIMLLGEMPADKAGHAFNVGGGPERSLSILQLFDWYEAQTGNPVTYRTGERRLSDQEVFISCNHKVESLTGWSPRISLEEGLGELLRQSRAL